MKNGILILSLICFASALKAANPPSSQFPERPGEIPDEVTTAPPTPNEALDYDFLVITAGPGGGWDVWIKGAEVIDDYFIHFDPAVSQPYYEVTNWLGELVAEGWTDPVDEKDVVVGPIEVGPVSIWFGTPNADTITTGTDPDIRNRPAERVLRLLLVV